MMEAGKRHMALAVCGGCDIGQCIDIDKLTDAASKAKVGLSLLKHNALCSEAGLAELKSLVLEKGVDRLAVAACSPRVMTREFEMDFE